MMFTDTAAKYTFAVLLFAIWGELSNIAYLMEPSLTSAVSYLVGYLGALFVIAIAAKDGFENGSAVFIEQTNK